MVAIYVRWILADKLTLEDVPERWRKKVEEKLTEISENASLEE